MNHLNKKPKLIAVVGPTASGKTSLAIALAKRFSGEIVSADSMQIYKDMSIATAAPTALEKEQVVHHLVEFLDPSEKFSVAEYVLLAKKTIAEIINRGNLPIVVGGTGLYVDSLLNGIEFTEEKTCQSMRDEIEKEYDSLGGDVMLQKLSELDPIAAHKLSANDKKRIVRAFEIIKTTGTTVTEQNELSKRNGKPYDEIIIGINYEDRQKLYDRINLRVDMMIENGLLEEAEKMASKGVTAAQAIGHKEFNEYFNGNVSLLEATEKLKQETRRYAKRQLIWFRRNEQINWIYADKDDVLEKAFEIIERKI